LFDLSTVTQEQHAFNDNVEDVKHDDKDGTNLALDIENDTDTDTTATTAQNHIKLVDRNSYISES
jgi:hypothetical protein